MTPLLPAAPTRGRRVAGAARTVPEIPRDRAIVGKRDRDATPVAKSMTVLPTGTRIVVARTPEGRYASHANKLVHLSVVTRHRPVTHTVNAKAARAMPQHAIAKAGLGRLLAAHTGEVTGLGRRTGQLGSRQAKAVAGAKPGMKAARTGRQLALGVKDSAMSAGLFGKALTAPLSRMPERGQAHVGRRIGASASGHNSASLTD